MSWRRAGPGDLPLAVLWGIAAVVAVLGAPALPFALRLAPPCALHALTGVPCFACGTCRAALALSHGDWLGALTLNPMAAAGMIGGLGTGFAAPLWALVGGPLPAIPASAHRALRIAVWSAFAAQWTYLVVAGR